MTEQTLVTIDGNQYNLADLSDVAKQQMDNIRFTDQEIERANNQLALLQTARGAYGKALAEALPKALPKAKPSRAKKH